LFDTQAITAPHSHLLETKSITFPTNDENHPIQVRSRRIDQFSHIERAAGAHAFSAHQIIPIGPKTARQESTNILLPCNT